MWLVLVTCLAWGLLFSYARAPQPWKLICYGLSLIAIVYSHPLGLLMTSSLALTSFIFRRPFHISWRRWLYIHLGFTMAIAPWVGHYLDHPPESITGLLTFQYLLGMPIGFIGGNFKVLFVCLLLIVYGVCRIQRPASQWNRVDFQIDNPSIVLLIWLMVPPLLLFAYSYVSHPIFGPSRYTLFVGPAYLVLLARGLSKLPWPIAIVAAVAGVILSCIMLINDVYRSDRYADWRSVAAY